MLSILIHKILSLALIMAAGWALVKSRAMTQADSRSLSALLVHLVLPCSIFSAFQMERTPQVAKGLALAMLAAVLLHLLMIAVTRLLKKPLHLSAVEQPSVLYTNAGNLIIPLVSAMLGPEWVIYTSAYILVQTFMTWSHGKSLICGERGINWRAFLKNPSIWSLAAGTALFLMDIRLPPLIGDTLGAVGAMVGPVSMLVTGMLLGTLSLGAVLRDPRVWLVSGLRLILLPLICLGLLGGMARLFPDSAGVFLVSMLAASAPTASLITTICQLEDREPACASRLCAATTVLCILTLPLMAWLYMTLFLR